MEVGFEVWTFSMGEGLVRGVGGGIGFGSFGLGN